MSDLSFIIDDMVFSFSRLNCFHQCPYQWMLQYIECVEGENNAFAEFGSLSHDILERYAKGELEIYELPLAYEEEYDKFVEHKFPPNKYVNLNESYKKQGREYFENFEGFGDYEIVSIEEEFEFLIDNIKIKGLLDLLVKDKDGNYHIIDHKSSDPKSAKSKKAQEYWMQMTLYAIWVYQKYGAYPVKLHINAFRKQQWFTIDFNEAEIDSIKKWVIDTVDAIKKEEKFPPKSDQFFCRFLCNFRNGLCEYIPQR